MFSGSDSSLSTGMCLVDFYALFKGQVRLNIVVFFSIKVSYRVCRHALKISCCILIRGLVHSRIP